MVNQKSPKVLKIKKPPSSLPSSIVRCARISFIIFASIFILMLLLAVTNVTTGLPMSTSVKNILEKRGIEYAQTHPGWFTAVYKFPASSQVQPIKIPTLVVHGLSSPHQIFVPLIEKLNKNGHNVFAYDLYGRGLSFRPPGIYDRERFFAQICSVVQYFDSPTINLIGFSLGGQISLDFANRIQQCSGVEINSLVLLAPAGFTSKKPLWINFIKIPFLGHLFMEAIGPYLLKSHTAHFETLNHHHLSRMRTALETQLRYGGYFRALLSTLLNYPLRGLNPHDFHDLAVGSQKCLIMSENDEIIPFVPNYKDLTQNIGFDATLILESELNLGHRFAFSRPDLLDDFILKCLD